MCGIYGFISQDKRISISDALRVYKIFLNSRRRGRDSSSLIYIKNNKIEINKFNSSPKIRMIKEIMKAYFAKTFIILGHTRLTTHSYSEDPNESNQPIIRNGTILLHNGIYIDDSDFVEKFTSDTDLLSAKLNIKQNEKERIEFLEKAKGEISVIFIDFHRKSLICFSNVGNLFQLKTTNKRFIASEKNFIKKFHSKIKVECVKSFEINIQGIKFKNDVDISNYYNKNNINTNYAMHSDFHDLDANILNRYKYLYEKSFHELGYRKCSRCLLPENFTNIEISNESGICDLCANFSNKEVKGDVELRKVIDNVLRRNKVSEVLVCLSGGRDSTFALHKVFEMGYIPIAYTYDWGFVSDAARINMAKICGDLGIEHILVSPNLYKTRLKVKRTLQEWLKYPNISTIPILMSQDKAFYKFANKISKERGGIPVILADHYAETTNFKAALAGAKNKEKQSKAGNLSYRISLVNLFYMAVTYTKYALNSPILFWEIFSQGSVSALNYYLRKHEYIHLFEFIEWDEKKVENTLKRYKWSSGLETKGMNWRMGDLTSPFYNLMYRINLGYDEFNTMDANLIRMGKLQKSNAKELKNEFINFFGQLHTYIRLLDLNPQEFIDQLETAASKLEHKRIN